MVPVGFGEKFEGGKGEPEISESVKNEKRTFRARHCAPDDISELERSPEGARLPLRQRWLLLPLAQAVGCP
jgi:hypothetical protein